MNKRFKGFEFWDGAVFGAFIATVFAIAITGIFNFLGEVFWPVVGGIVVAPVALAGALIAVRGNRFQIEHERERNLAASRATLPLALSEMMEVARNGLLIAAGQHPSDPHNSVEISQILRLSPETLTTLQNCIRAADKNTQDWLAVTIASYQVYFSRASELAHAPRPTIASGSTSFCRERESALLDWATFHALVEHHFEFARGESESVNDTLDVGGINSAFFLTLNNINFDSGFQEAIRRRLASFNSGRASDFFER